MVSNRFSLYDLFVNIIPGTLALLLALAILTSRFDAIGQLTELGISGSTIFLLLGYILGHFIQAISSIIDSWWMRQELSIFGITKKNRLYPFENLLAKAENGDGYSVVKHFLEGYPDFFDEDIDGYELFSVTQSYLWNQNIGRMRRFQALYTLFRSLWVVLFFGASLYLLRFMVSLWNTGTLNLDFLYTSILLSMGALLAYSRRMKFHKSMAEAMIVDFYANVLAGRDEST